MLVFFFLAFTVQFASATKYFILIDAGSSGSRIHVHPYKVTDSVPIIDASYTLKEKPGLSSFGKHPENAGSSMVKLIEFAKTHVPVNQWAETQLHLQATAGLRSIPEQASYQVLENVRDELQKSPFSFKREDALIITGTQEGINGWLTTNYLLGVFNSSKPSTGVAEVGGASMQLTYEPLKLTNEREKSNLYPIAIGGRKFLVYTHSYLGYGLEKAQLLYQKLNFDQIEEKGNPCYPLGYRHSSTGSFENCQKEIKSLWDKEDCQYSSCGFQGVFQPKITTEKFFAIENFFYTASFFSVSHQMGFLERIETAGLSFCQDSWSNLKKTYPKADDEELSKYCFSAAYLPQVLREAYNFPEDADVEIKKEINGNDIDWALGAVLNKLAVTTTIGSEKNSGPKPVFDIHCAQCDEMKNAFCLGNGSILVMLAVIMAIFVYQYKSKEKISTTPRWRGKMNSMV